MLETRPSSLPQGDVRLRDGRRLAYAEYGDPNGRPVLFFHGTPGSRLFHHPDESIAAAVRARIIAIDRPGFGRSDFKPGRQILDWPDDVLQLADALHLTRFAVLGYSGGGAYAVACALSIPDRLTGIGVVSSVAPMGDPEITRGMHGIGHVFLNLDRHLSPLAKLGTGLMCNLWRDNPEAYFKSQLEGLRDSEPARALVPGVKAMLTADFREAIRSGTDGVTLELKLLSQPWGFQPGAIKAEVLLWHGESDTETPVAMGKRLAGAIPHCRASFFPREGHWAIYVHWREVLTALLANAGLPPVNDFTRTPLAISTLPDPSADSGQGLPPASLAADATPPETSRADTANRAEAPENRKMSIVEVIESLADAPPEVPADAPLKAEPAAEAPAAADASAPATDAAAPVPEVPAATDEPPEPVPEAPIAAAEAPVPAEVPARPADSSAPLPDVTAPLAEEPAPAGEEPEAVPEAPNAAAEAPVPAGEAPPAAARKRPARRGKASPEAAEAASSEPMGESPAPSADEPSPAPKKKRPHTGEASRGKAPTPEAKREKEERRPAPEKSKTAAKAPSRPSSGGARGRTSGEAGAGASTGKAAPPARKPAKRSAEPAAKGTPRDARSAADHSETTPRKPSSGRRSGKEAVHV